MNNNSEIVYSLKYLFENTSKSTGMTTNKIRKISSEEFKKHKNKSFEEILNICEILLEERRWELGIIAYDWAFRLRKDYNNETFACFEKWLNKYITGWGDCDDFCTHAFGELLSQRREYFEHILKWTNSEKFQVRRAAAVIMIYPIKKGKYEELFPFEIADRLMNDEHDLVLKGYGWMLKILSQKEPEKVYEYLVKNRNKMPRVSFRYAMEKLDEDKKRELMR